MYPLDFLLIKCLSKAPNCRQSCSLRCHLPSVAFMGMLRQFYNNLLSDAAHDAAVHVFLPVAIFSEPDCIECTVVYRKRVNLGERSCDKTRNIHVSTVDFPPFCGKCPLLLKLDSCRLAPLNNYAIKNLLEHMPVRMLREMFVIIILEYWIFQSHFWEKKVVTDQSINPLQKQLTAFWLEKPN